MQHGWGSACAGAGPPGLGQRACDSTASRPHRGSSRAAVSPALAGASSQSAARQSFRSRSIARGHRACLCFAPLEGEQSASLNSCTARGAFPFACEWLLCCRLAQVCAHRCSLCLRALGPVSCAVMNALPCRPRTSAVVAELMGHAHALPRAGTLFCAPTVGVPAAFVFRRAL